MSSPAVLLQYVLTLTEQANLDTTKRLAELSAAATGADRQNLLELMEAASLGSDQPIAALIGAIRNAEEVGEKG
jgi:hypothetical protein